VLRVARREPSAVLLAAQLAGVLLYPFMDSEGVGRALFSVFGITVVQAIDPGSFIAAVNPSGERSWMELLFLSFTTLSSTGLSDVVPVKDFARSVVMLEQLAGLAYVAMVVSRLVGLLVLNRRGDAA
jgi:hypothetical protein